VAILLGVNARLLVEVPPVEDDHRTGVPGDGEDLVAHGELGPLELGEVLAELVGAQGGEVGEAVRETIPEDLGLVVLHRVDIGKVRPPGRAPRKAPVKDLLVPQVHHLDLDVGVELVEAGNHRLQSLGGDVPAPDRDLALQGRVLGPSQTEKSRHCQKPRLHIVLL
jgi:hypothetical protein